MAKGSITSTLPNPTTQVLPDLVDLGSVYLPVSVYLHQKDSTDGLAKAGQFSFDGIMTSMTEIQCYPLLVRPTRSMDESSRLPKSDWCYSLDRIKPDPRVKYPGSPQCKTCMYALTTDPKDVQCRLQATLYAYDAIHELNFMYRLRGVAYLNFARTYKVMEALHSQASDNRLIYCRIRPYAATSGAHGYFTVSFDYSLVEATSYLIEVLLESKKMIQVVPEDEVPEAREDF